MNKRFEGLTLTQLKSSEHVKSENKFLMQTNSIAQIDLEKLITEQEFVQVWEDAKKYWNASYDEIAEEDLPQQWDWRNVSGYDFTTKVYD